MRRTLPLAAISIALCSTSAIGGVRIETLDRNIQTKAASGPPQTIYVQNGNVRVASGPAGSMLLKGSTIYVIDDKRRTYREMDKATMQGYAKQTNAAMSQMQEQMAKMSPQEREMMQKMMGGNMPGMAPAKQDVYASKDTGKNDTAEGRNCRLWNISKNGKLQEEICVVPFASLPGKEDFQKTFKNLAEAFEGMASAMPNAANDAKARSAIDGYPVRVRRYENGKRVGTETVLKTWNEEALAASLFEVPAGYKKQAMP
jgi:Domain of unknown function (DUF4412)